MFSSLETLKLSNKFWLAVILLSTHIAHADCSIDERDGGKTLYLQQDGKRIAILGWKAPSETETIRTNIGMANVIKSTATNCEQLAGVVKPVLVQQKALNSSTEDLTKRLNEVPFLKSSTLGVEMSEMGWKTMQESKTQMVSMDTSKKIYDLFTQIGTACPDQRSDFNLFMSEVISPINVVAIEARRAQKLDLKIKGMDDFQLRDEYFRNTTQQSRNYNFNDQSYSAETKEKLNPIIKAAHENLETPSEEAIKEITNTIQDPILKGKTLDALRTLQIGTRTSRTRNEKIMENIMATPGNITMTINEAHLKGLKTEFQKYCTTNKTATAPTPSETNQ